MRSQAELNTSAAFFTLNHLVIARAAISSDIAFRVKEQKKSKYRGAALDAYEVSRIDLTQLVDSIDESLALLINSPIFTDMQESIATINKTRNDIQRREHFRIYGDI